MDRKYNLRLDLQFRCNNSKMVFDEFDNNTSDFFIRVTRAGELIDISKAIVTLVVIKPDNSVDAQFVEINSNRVYCDLKPTMKNLVGKYEAIASITLDGETINTDIKNPIIYEVTENKFLRQLNEKIVTEERFTILTDMINRLSSIETNENTRIGNENFRVEAEKLREQAIEKIKNDATKLITDTKKEINDYKDAKDIAIELNLNQYKEATTQDINNYKNTKNTEIDNYKNTKDLAIDNDLKQYKTNTTEDITQFKNTKNNELDEYKNAKNLEIDNYVINKNLEIDNYKSAKDIEIDNYKNLKDTEINSKLEEVDTAETLRTTAEQKRVIDHQSREEFLNGFEGQLAQIESKNIEQDTRLKDVENKNKVLDVYARGLFNENKDGRLSVEGEGNSLKLEGSKNGLVEIDSIVGNTFVNIFPFTNEYNTISWWNEISESALSRFGETTLNRFEIGKTYTMILLNNPCITEVYISALNMSWSTFVNSIATFTVGSNADLTNNLPRNLMFRVSRQITDDELAKLKIMIFEGDYTNKPIPSEVFEGLQSSFESNLITQEMVTQGLESEENLGKYKVSVKVTGKNLFDGQWEQGSIDNLGQNNSNSNSYRCVNYIYVSNIQSIAFDYPLNIFEYDKDKNFIVKTTVTNKSHTLNPNTCYIRFYRSSLETSLQIEEGTVATDYEDYFERTANVYLNSPLLEDDEIVCKEDGLYHYHKMKQVVLDGSGDWIKADTSITTTHIKTSVFLLEVTGSNAGSLCDKFVNNTNMTSDTEFYYYNTSFFGGSKLVISINNSKLSTQNLTGFKAWLKANPTTVVYELADPYYEKISDDKLLLEIPNNATLSVESVIPCQSISATYTGNVPSVYGLEETNKNQDNLIDISLMATDEMYMMLEPILEAMPQTINERMISKMVDMYVAMVIRGLKTIEEVPVRYRKEVQTILDKLEK